MKQFSFRRGTNTITLWTALSNPIKRLLYAKLVDEIPNECTFMSPYYGLEE